MDTAESLTHVVISQLAMTWVKRCRNSKGMFWHCSEGFIGPRTVYYGYGIVHHPHIMSAMLPIDFCSLNQWNATRNYEPLSHVIFHHRIEIPLLTTNIFNIITRKQNKKTLTGSPYFFRSSGTCNKKNR